MLDYAEVQHIFAKISICKDTKKNSFMQHLNVGTFCYKREQKIIHHYPKSRDTACRVRTSKANPKCKDARSERPNEQSESKSACRVSPRPHRGRTPIHDRHKNKKSSTPIGRTFFNSKTSYNTLTTKTIQIISCL